MLLDLLCRRCIEVVPDFNTIDCASMLFGFAKLHYRPRDSGRELMDHLLGHTLHLLQVGMGQLRWPQAMHEGTVMWLVQRPLTVCCSAAPLSRLSPHGRRKIRPRGARKNWQTWRGRSAGCRANLVA